MWISDLIADGYNLLLGIFSVPLSTSHTNMSRSEQALPEAPSDLEINLSLRRLVVEKRARSLQQSLPMDYYRTGTYLEVTANVIMPHLTFQQIPTAVPATLN